MGRDGWGDIGAVKNGRVYNADSNAFPPGAAPEGCGHRAVSFLNDDEAEEAPPPDPIITQRAVKLTTPIFQE